MIIQRLTLSNVKIVDGSDFNDYECFNEFIAALTYIEDGDDIRVNINIDELNNEGNPLYYHTYKTAPNKEVDFKQVAPLRNIRNCVGFLKDEIQHFCERNIEGFCSKYESDVYKALGFDFARDYWSVEEF